MTKATEMYTTYFFCPRCQEETEHAVLYVGPQIKDIRCFVCDRELRKSADAVRGDFVHHLPQRAEQLAIRGVRSFRRHPISFVTHLPRSVVVKSLDVCAELYAMLGESDRAS